MRTDFPVHGKVPKEQGGKRGDVTPTLAATRGNTPVKPKNTLRRVSAASKARAERYGHAMNFLKGFDGL